MSYTPFQQECRGRTLAGWVMQIGLLDCRRVKLTTACWIQVLRKCQWFLVVRWGVTLKYVRFLVRLQVNFISSFKLLIVSKCLLCFILKKEKCHSSKLTPLFFNSTFSLKQVNIHTVILFIFQVTEYLYANKMAFRYPEPEDKAKYIREKIWRSEYDSLLPDVYEWPESASGPPQIME